MNRMRLILGCFFGFLLVGALTLRAASPQAVLPTEGVAFNVLVEAGRYIVAM